MSTAGTKQAAEEWHEVFIATTLPAITDTKSRQDISGHSRGGGRARARPEPAAARVPPGAWEAPAADAAVR